MGFNDEYMKLRKKRLEEQQKRTPNTSFVTEDDIKRGNVIVMDDVDDIDNKYLGTGGILDNDGFIKAGAFSDGFDILDIPKAIFGTAGDAVTGIVQGVAGIGEGIGDLISYGVAGVQDLLGYDDAAESTRKEASKSQLGPWFDSFREKTNIGDYSLLGDTGYGVAQGVGQVLTTVASGGLGGTAASTGVVFASSTGSGMSEAYQGGATDEEAIKYGVASGVINAGTEAIFGGLGKSVQAVGVSKGISSLDDIAAQKIGSKLGNRYVANAAEYGVKASAEGFEEVLAGYLDAHAKKGTYMSEEEFKKILEDEELFDQFVTATFASGIVQGGDLVNANKQGRDFITNFSANEETVIEKVYNDRVAEAEQDGKKLTNKEKNKLYEQVQEDMRKGYISTDTIESVLGGKTYKTYKEAADRDTALKKEYEALNKEYTELYKMKNGEKSDEQIDRQAELKKQLAELKQKIDNSDLSQLKANLSKEVYDSLTRKVGKDGKNTRTDDFLIESYNESARRGTAFEADLSQYDDKTAEVVKRAIDSGILNNTRRTHEFVDMLAKISADKGVLFDFTNNQKLKESGFAVNGASINGYVTKDGITVNISSSKATNTIVGHEITHVLEGTELYAEMQKTLFEYSKSKNDYDSRRKALEELYKNVEGADIDAELTADLVGDYLFTDADFINNLSTKHRNVFQKIYDEIKYLLKVATKGSKEARELEKVKRAFDKAYRANGNTNEGTKYSLSQVEAVQPTSDKWKRTLTTEEAKARFPKLWDVTADDSEVRNPTQISSTVNSYRKVYNFLKSEGFDGTILDASSGLGYGTKAGIEEYGFDVEDIEPYPDKSYNPKYRDYSTLDKKYDVVISNAVLNVLPQDQRDALVVKMGEMLNDGGRIFINVRGKDVDTLANNKSNTNISPMEWFVDSTGSYQKGFTKPELVAYLQDALGEGFTVKPTNMFGAVSAVVTKDSNVKYSLSDSDGKKLTKEQSEYFKDSKMRDDNGNLKVMYHGSQYAGFHEFDSDFSDDNKSFFFVDRNDVAATYSGTSETYAAPSLRTAEDFNKFFAENGLSEYSVKEEMHGDYKWFVLYEDGAEIASSETAKMLYDEFRDWTGLGEGEANYKVYLDLKNPLVVDAEGRNWNRISGEFSQEVYNRYQTLTEDEKEALVQLAAWEDASVFRDELLTAVESVERGASYVDDYTRNLASAAEKLGDADKYRLFDIATDNFSEESLRENAVNYLKTRDYAQRAKEQGYDGVIFKNIVDNGGYASGNEGASTVAIAFESNQIKSVANEKPTSNPDIRYSLSEYTEEEKKAHNKAVLEHFGKTYSWAETGYLLLDGTRLDLSGKHDGAPGGYRTVDHRDITEALGYDYGGGDYSGSLVQFMSEGNIRIIPECNGINLSVKPTKAQEQALSNYISRYRGEVLLDIDDLNGNTVVSVEYPYGTYYTTVLNDIREWFDNGKKPKNSGSYSLTKEGETPKRYGNYNIFGEDIRLEAPAQEEVAPIQEDVAPMPNEPTIYDLEQKQAELEDTIRKAMESNDPNAPKLIDEYGELLDTIAKRKKEESAMESERLASLDDADVPPEMEAPYYGESTDTAPENPFEERDIKAVGNRQVKAYMYENPEVKPFFQEEANRLLKELRDGTKGERWFNDQLYYDSGGEYGFSGTKRHVSADIAYLLDNLNFSYADIEKGINAIIEDNGKENNAASKRIEFILNDRLLKGYTDFTFGYDVPPNQDYINLLNEKQIIEYSDEARAKFFEEADKYAPPMEDIAPIAENTTVNEPKIDKPIEDAPIAEAYEAIKPKKEKTTEPRLKRVKEGEQNPDGIEPPKVAEILTEEPITPKKKNRAFTQARTNLLDKGSVFEDLSLKTGNRELQGKYNFMHYSEARAQKYIADNLKPIVDKAEQLGKIEELYEYAYHLHNIDRMSLEAKGGTNKAVFGDTITADISREAVKKLESDNPEFKELEKEIVEYNAGLRQMLVDAGVISQETADLWAEMYPHYVPIRRLGDEGLSVNVPLDTRKTGINAPIKRATGGNRDIMPLFDTMAMRTEQTFKAIAKNNFGTELMHTLDSTVESNATSLDDVIDSFDNHEELLQEGKNGKNPTFTVFDNGKRVTFEITEDMYDALKPTSKGLSYTNKVANTASNIFRGIVTEYNPVFMVSNAAKDIQDVLINSQHAAKTYANIPKAIKELTTKGKWHAEYMANGGEQNTYFDSESKTFKEENKGFIKTIGMPLRAISTANNFIERIPRLAEYIASREAGASVEVAMLDAARVTTNFAAGGDVTKFLNRNGATFLNASVQGFNQNVRNVREAKANGLKGWVKLTAKVALAGVPALLLNNLLWDDDEEYEELSEYVKDKYYIVAKTEDGKFIRIPKGRVAAVIQDAFEQINNAVTGNDEVDFKNFFNLVISNLAPNNPIENNILAPIIQVANNKTWYGEDLVPTRLQDLPAGEQYDESTDAFSKWLGEKTNISPYKLNYLLNQYSGGVGDVFLPMLTPEAESGDNSFKGNILAPMKDKFTTDSTLNNKNVSAFYDTMDELTTNAKSSKATDEDILKYKYFNSINAELSELYAQKREIQNSDLADDEKYAAVRELQEQINDLARESLNTYENVYISDGYASIGDIHYRWYEPGEDSDAEAGWQKITDKQLEKQEAVTSYLGVEPSEYWKNKTEYDFAYEYPEKYSVAKSVGGYSAYKRYTSELYDIKADKDEDGKSISGSRKEKVIEYVNNLDIDYGARLILFKSEYNADDTYNYDIIDYLNNRQDISYEEMETILKELGFTVLSDGTIQWD